MSQINITAIVDVVQALSERTLKGNVYMMDTSPKSKHQGTDRLITACYPGQVIHWEFRAVDVQTRFEVTDISIRGRDDCRLLDEDCRCSKLYSDKRWVGRVSLSEGTYHYAITVQMGNGRNSERVLETAALRVLPRSRGRRSRQRSCCWEPPAICPPWYPYWPHTPYAGYCPPYTPTCSPLPPYAPLPPWCPPAPYYPDCGSRCETDWGYCPCASDPCRSGCGCDSYDDRPESWDCELVPQRCGHQPPPGLFPPAQVDPEEVT